MRTWRLTLEFYDDKRGDAAVVTKTKQVEDGALRFAPVPTAIITEEAATAFREVVKELQRVYPASV